jgi:hypothetical protein
MIGALLAAAASVATPFEASAEEPYPALSALGPQPAGATALTLRAGRPFHGIRLDHGLWDALDVGLGFDVWPEGFYRPTVQVRVRALELGRFQATLRGTVGHVLGPGGVNANDGELALQLGFAFLPRLGAFAEGSLLGSTDFTREHTAGFTQVQGGLAFAPPGSISLIASVGVLQGSRSARAIGSGGAAFRF